MTASKNFKLLAFDVFGTVVDWQGSIVREINRLRLHIDSNAFAIAWRAAYHPAMARVRSGELGWLPLDDLHRMILDDLLARFGVRNLTEDAINKLNMVWHRLDPWPDAVAGLSRLKRSYTICTLSNGNVSLLTDMADRAGLPWDSILSAELFRHYKPDPEVYLGAARQFHLQPPEVMMIAAHHDDLAAARACGLATAYIERPTEYGAANPKDISPDPRNTLHAKDLHELADLLGCPARD
jgi:2-haloacid dehalogenase